MVEFSKIKLVIWDLDDTFWDGTLSEGDVLPIESNIGIVKSLADHGIINSICSKNDREPVDAKLKELDVDSYFVFPSVNWEPKGPRVRNMLDTMGLRPQNCLFVDDNPQNLNEVSYHCEGIMTAQPDILISLKSFIDGIPPADLSHKRLAQYRILEKKTDDSKNYSDNTEFLFSSNIRVSICRDCMSEIERISDLVLRSNQLNFTKKRDSREELERIISDTGYDTGYVSVSDKYGDYGIVGFFAIKDNRCIHFLFSCRTIGQGIEEYVYAKLGHPALDVVEPVINHVSISAPPAWINRQDCTTAMVQKESGAKIIFKGGCDLAQMSEYLDTSSIIEEFTYIGAGRHNNIEHHNHSVNYLQWHFMPEETKRWLVDRLVFNDGEMFETAMYDGDASLIILSTMIEPNLGVYRHRESGMKIAFGERIYPLTDRKNWPLYIHKRIYNADNDFTEEWLEWFSSEFEYMGNLSPEEIVENARKLLSKVAPQTRVCYILGPEIPYLAEERKNYEGRHVIYAEINRLFRDFARENDRVLLLDSNRWVRSQGDFTNNINHWQRNVYFQMARCVNEHIRELAGTGVRQKSRLYLLKKSVIDRIGRTGFFQTYLWQKIRGYR